MTSYHKSQSFQKIIEWSKTNRMSFVIVVIGMAVTILMLAVTLNPSYFLALMTGKEKAGYLEGGLDRVSAVASDLQLLQVQVDISGNGDQAIDNLQLKTRYVCKKSDGTVNNWGYKTVTKVGVPENVAVLIPNLNCAISVLELLPETKNGVAWSSPEYTVPVSDIDFTGVKYQLLKIGLK